MSSNARWPGLGSRPSRSRPLRLRLARLGEVVEDVLLCIQQRWLRVRDTPPTAPTRSPAHRHPPPASPAREATASPGEPRASSAWTPGHRPRWPGNACRHGRLRQSPPARTGARRHRAGHCGCRPPRRTPSRRRDRGHQSRYSSSHTRLSRLTTFADNPRAASSPTRAATAGLTDPSIPRAGTDGTAASTLALRRSMAAPAQSGTVPPSPTGCAPSAPERPPHRSRSESPFRKMTVAHHPAPTVWQLLFLERR